MRAISLRKDDHGQGRKYLPKKVAMSCLDEAQNLGHHTTHGFDSTPSSGNGPTWRWH